MIHYGGNSGYQAINLAYLWGARAIVLLGLDCKAAPDGRAHWFGQHAAPLNARQLYDNWQVRFKPLADDLARLGVPVLNASRTTALDCFPRVALEAALADPALASRGGSRHPGPKTSPATI